MNKEWTMERNKTQFMYKYGLSFLLIGIQILDILMHLITNQFEIIRAQSNIIIIMWSFFLFIPTRKFSRNIVSTISISIYLILNALFLFQYGMINPNNDSLRIALLLFVGLTTCISFVQISQMKKGK